MLWHHVNKSLNMQKSKLAEFHSNNSTEVVNMDTKISLDCDSIQHCKTVPYTPQQNGRAERLNRTIMEKAEAMRLDACIPPSWWEFSVYHVVHLYNRTPIKRLDWKTPYEIIHEK